MGLSGSLLMGRRRLAASLQSLLARRSCFSAGWPKPSKAHGRVLGNETRPESAPSTQGYGLHTIASSIYRSECQRVDGLNSLSRALWYKQTCAHTSGQDFDGAEKISVTFVDKDGDETKIEVPVGMSMLEAAHENEIELEGACEGSLACSTCHVIVMDEDMFNKLPEPSDEENDMLDLAFGLTETSRLGCQVIAKPELDGLHLALPAATRNFAVDGHVPKPH